MDAKVGSVTDIMQDYKNRRFVVAPNYIGRGLDPPVYGHIVLLTDIGYWADNIDDLIAWCSEHKCMHQGMTVDIPTDQLLTLFCLRWSG